MIYYDKRGMAVALGAEEPQMAEVDGDDELEDEPQKLEWCVVPSVLDEHVLTGI